MSRFLTLVLCGIAVSSLAACSTMTEDTQKLHLGMSEAQVKDILGGRYTVRASKYAADGQPIEAWEYQDPDSREVYWVYFKGGKLVQWGTPEAIRAIPELHDAALNERGLDKIPALGQVY